MRAKSSSRFWPELRWLACASFRSVRPTRARIWRAAVASCWSRRRSAGIRSRLRHMCVLRSGALATSRFSKVDSDGHSVAAWKVRMTPSAAIRLGAQPVIAVPLAWISPSSGRAKPVIRSTTVLFPAPFGPIRPVTEPSWTVSVQSATACTPPKAFDIPCRDKALTGRSGWPARRGRAAVATRSRRAGSRGLVAGAPAAAPLAGPAS
jgi:hypothetical protein